MTEESKLTLEILNREVEKIGSLLYSVSVQISGIRARVADLELGDPFSGVTNRGETTLGGKDEHGDKRSGKRPDGRPGKGKEGQGKGKQGKGGKRGKGGSRGRVNGRKGEV